MKVKLEVDIDVDRIALAVFADSLAKKVIDEITLRRGLRQTWEEFDTDIQADILSSMAYVIKKALKEELLDDTITCQLPTTS